MTALEVALPASAEVHWRQYGLNRELRDRDVLVEHYLPYARSIAASVYRRRFDDSVAFDDYLQYARLGLMQAVERFDPARRIVFEAYAARRVRGAILNGLGQESEVAAQRYFQRARARERRRSIQESEPEAGGLERMIRVTVTLAISAMLDEDFDDIPDEGVHANPYAAAELAQLAAQLRALVDTLPERERWLVTQHYIGGIEFQELAEQLQVTKGRVSQLHGQALHRLRGALKATQWPQGQHL